MFKEMKKQNLYDPLYLPRKYTQHSVCVILMNEERIKYWDVANKYLSEHFQITNKEFCDLTGLDTLKASELLKKWVKQKLLEKVGDSKKKTAYKKPVSKKAEQTNLLEGLF